MSKLSDKEIIKILKKNNLKATPQRLVICKNVLSSDNHPTAEQIYDLIAMRVIVDTITDCYHVLGLIHTIWTPVADRFHDYIANPKSNMYRSLHTSVVGPYGKKVEIQIRTHAMHYASEYGIAAHWLYKEGKKGPGELDEHMSWIREILEMMHVLRKMISKINRMEWMTMVEIPGKTVTINSFHRQKVLKSVQHSFWKREWSMASGFFQKC